MESPYIGRERAITRITKIRIEPRDFFFAAGFRSKISVTATVDTPTAALVAATANGGAATERSIEFNLHRLLVHEPAAYASIDVSSGT